MATARALRRNLAGGADSFPQDVVELIGYFGRRRARPARARRPRRGHEVPVWILGSSLFGAQLAAHARPALRLRLAFRARRARAGDRRSTARRFRPSDALGAAVRDARPSTSSPPTPTPRRRRLFTSLQQAFVNLRSGRPGPLPRPVDDIAATLDPTALAMVDRALACSAIGSPEHRRARGSRPSSRRTGADELILTGADPRPRRPPALLRDRRRGDALARGCAGVRPVGQRQLPPNSPSVWSGDPAYSCVRFSCRTIAP